MTKKFVKRSIPVWGGEIEILVPKEVEDQNRAKHNVMLTAPLEVARPIVLRLRIQGYFDGAYASILEYFCVTFAP